MISKNLLNSFLVQWRAHYRSKPQLEFDNEWLWTHFKMYWGFLQQILGLEHDLLVCNVKQWKAYKTAVTRPETLNHRTRRGGKTLMLSHMCVFFAELGFGSGSLSGKVIYRCPHNNQLKGLLQWLRQSPFYIKRRQSDYEVILLNSPHPLDVACLSESTCVGMECAVLIEDEYSTIKKGGRMETWMKDSRAFLAKGETWEKRHIHASSGRKNSPFEDDYLFLLTEDPEAIIVMPWNECSWITETYIDKEKRKNFMSNFWIEEQYECLWVLASGSFFDQTKLNIVDEIDTCVPTTAGIDFNGEVVGHVMLLVHQAGNTLFIFDEIIFQSIFEIAEWIKDHPEIQVEAEGTQEGRGGGYNAGYASTLQEMNVNAGYEAWNDPDTKQYRVGLLQRSIVYVNASCRWFIKNFKEATFDPMGDKRGSPKMMKTTDQHGVDACLHAIGNGGSLDNIGETNWYADQQFEQFADGIKYR